MGGYYLVHWYVTQPQKLPRKKRAKFYPPFTTPQQSHIRSRSKIPPSAKTHRLESCVLGKEGGGEEEGIPLTLWKLSSSSSDPETFSRAGKKTAEIKRRKKEKRRRGWFKTFPSFSQSELSITRSACYGWGQTRKRKGGWRYGRSLFSLCI